MPPWGSRARCSCWTAGTAIVGSFQGPEEEVLSDLRALCERNGVCDTKPTPEHMCITCGAALTLYRQARYIEKLQGRLESREVA